MTNISKPPCIDLGECYGLGDLICATPVIRKLHEVYEHKVTVLSPMPELFKNNPNVYQSYKKTSVDLRYFEANYTMHNSFYSIGKKDERGIEMKHNVIDIRQFHAIKLGFMLTDTQMECTYIPNEPFNIELPEKYVVIHPVKSWPVRTYPAKKWMELTQRINDMGIAVVSVGKDASETGFFSIDKPVFNFEIPNGLNLMNKTNISDTWNILNKATAVITCDSGILHLAGTTDTNIIHLGGSIHHLFRAPYRYNSQNYKYHYVCGECQLACASNMRHGVEEWGDIQGVPPLIGCLLKKKTYECHPTVDQIIKTLEICL